MVTMPHDVTDLNLAPVALAVDAQLEELGRLDAKEFAFQIAMKGDKPDWTVGSRGDGLVDAVGRSVLLHDWVLSIDPRGLRLTHKQNSIVLGVPDNFRAYLAGE